jgi:hypothetical protein
MIDQVMTPHGMITIRPAQETDAQAYRALRLEALQNNPEAFSADYATNEKRPMSFWQERLRAIASNNMFYFALDNNDLVGTCGIYRGDSPEVILAAGFGYFLFIKREPAAAQQTRG